MATRSGGGGLGGFFKLSSDGTKLVKADGTTEATTINDALMITGSVSHTGNDIITSTEVSYDDSSVPTIKVINTKYDKISRAFIDTVLPRRSTTAVIAPGELTDETGRTIGGTGSATNATKLVYIGKGAEDENKETPFVIIPHTMKASSYGRSWKAKTYPEITLEGVGIAATTDISIPASIFQSMGSLATAAVTLEQSYYEVESFQKTSN